MAESVKDAVISSKSANSIPFHMLEKLVGSGCAKFQKKVAEGMRRQIDYAPYPWVSSADIYDNVYENLDILTDIDSRASSLLTRGDYNLQRIGVPLPAKVVRERLELPNPLDNELWVDSANAVVEHLKSALREKFPTADAIKNATTLAKWKRTASRGDALDCVKSEEGALRMRQEVIPHMESHARGLFAYAGQKLHVMSPVRRQLTGMTRMTDGGFEPKLRPALIYNENNDLEWATHRNLDDGQLGMRVRLVNAIPTVTNGPLIVGNSYIFSNLNSKFKKIWKKTPNELIATAKDEFIICTDFSQFEFTQPPEVRYFITDQLYSPEMNELVREIDRYPLINSYTDEINGEMKTIYSLIDRWDDPEAAALWSHLASGTGDTAVQGKIQGLISQTYHSCYALQIHPRDFWNPYKNAKVSLVEETLEGMGDDGRTRFRILEQFGFDEKNVHKIIDRYMEGLDEAGIYDITVENPPKYTGLNHYYEDGEYDPHKPCLGCGHDRLTFFSGGLFPEQPWDSKVRGDWRIGLYQRIQVYRDTMTREGLFDEEFFSHLVALKLKLINFDGGELDLKALHDEAQKEQEELLNDPNTITAAVAIAEAVRILGLRDASELDYKVDYDEVRKLVPEEILAEIYIHIPEQLTKGLDRFLNIN